MGLIVPMAPQNVDLHVHFSHMAAADDLMPDLEAVLLETDMLIPEALGWSGALEVAIHDAVHRKVKPQPSGTNLLFGQAGPFMLALTEKLYDSPATPFVGFNDIPTGTPTAMQFAEAHLALSEFEEALALGWRKEGFDSVVSYCQTLCMDLNAAKLRRANHMLKRLSAAVNRARKRQAELQDRTPLKVLMLTGIDYVDLGRQLELSAEQEPTFTVSTTKQESIETCMITQFREYVNDGTVSALSAAALIARTILLNARLPKNGQLTQALRSAVDLEVATMGITDIQRLYER